MMESEEKEPKKVYGICSECKEWCEGEIEEDGWSYSECCGVSVYAPDGEP